MDRLIILTLITAFLSVTESAELCKTAVVCTKDGKSTSRLKRIPKTGLPEPPTPNPLVPPLPWESDPTASENCKSPGWVIGVGGYQYKIVSNLATWEEANNDCTREGGSLPRETYKDPEAVDFLVSMMKDNGDKYGFWLPLSDRAVESQWEWQGGEPLTDDSYWADYQPDNSGDCAYVSRDMGYKWDDGTCTGTFAALCERMI